VQTAHNPSMGVGFRQEVRAIRARLELSQGEFGKRGPLHRNTISRIEKGELTYDQMDEQTRVLLARACGLSPEDLARLAGAEEPHRLTILIEEPDLGPVALPADVASRMAEVAERYGERVSELLTRLFTPDVTGNPGVSFGGLGKAPGEPGYEFEPAPETGKESSPQSGHSKSRTRRAAGAGRITQEPRSGHGVERDVSRGGSQQQEPKRK